jgi:hypothetical protein
MADWRRYTGTKTLQLGWTVLVLAVVAIIEIVATPGSSPLFTVGGSSLVWVAGLVVLGLRDRRQWNRMVDESSFEPDPGAHTADLQKIIHGQSVTVTTDVPGILSQAHTRVRANIESVDASFKIRISDAARTDGNRGITTGNEALDEQFVIEGTAENVKALLSTDVQSVLMDLETPGTITVTADRATYEVPFTRLTGEELDTAGRAVAIMADRIETVGQS